MKYLKLTLLVSSIFMLSGCKTLVETNVKLSELQTLKINKSIKSDLYVQVPACNDFEDSRKESSSLIESKQTIPSIFKDAQYIECFQKEFESFTHFTIPMILSNGNELDTDYINIISNEKNLLSMGIPYTIKSNIDRVKNNSFGMTDLDLNVQITLENDKNTTLKFTALSTYINDKPYVYENLTLSHGYSININLSDVSVDNALENGSSNILFYRAE